MGSILETSWRTAASISCRTTRRWWFRTSRPRRTPTGAARRESIPSIYPAAGSDVVANGCHFAGRYCQLYAIAGLGAAGSRLSDHSGGDVLSRSKPEGGGDDRDGAPGASIRPTTRLEPDDLVQLGRNFRDRAAVQPHPEY